MLFSLGHNLNMRVKILHQRRAVILWSTNTSLSKSLSFHQKNLSFFVSLEPSPDETASMSPVTAIGSSVKQSNTPTSYLVKSGPGNNSLIHHDVLH